LQTKQLGGRPFDQNGVSYWEADWPQPIGESQSIESKDSTFNESGEKQSNETYSGESPGKSTSERYLF
jgi:hypothetical protein